MPNRIIKESICTSDNLTALDWGAQMFFVRLTVQCDDFGRFDGRPAILRAACYPLEMDRVSEALVQSWLDALEAAQLVQQYAVDGKRYLALSTWSKHQHPRAKTSKYPDPPHDARTCTQMQADSSTCMHVHAHAPGNGNENVNENRESRIEGKAAQTAAPPTPPVAKPRRVIDHSTVPLSEDLDLLHVAYQQALGYAPTGSLPIGVAKQALTKLLNDGRSEADVAGCTRWLASSGSPPSLMKVCDQMQEWIKQDRPAKANGKARASPVRRDSDWSDATARRQAEDTTAWPAPIG